MNDMTILHLSDLHIDETGASYSRLLSNLLIDIKSEIKYVRDNSLLLVVTGDIIHKGPEYSKNHKAVDHAITFFKKLHEILKEKVVGIYIVPGNHDKHRSDKEKFLINAYRDMEKEYTDSYGVKKSKFNSEFYNDFWNNHLDSYMIEHGSGYIELTKEIYHIFGKSEEDLQNKSFVDDTFGVDIINVLGKNYCIILLNTAWSCVDDDDNRQLILGEFQVERIKEQFQNIVNQYDDLTDINLTIVLGHHPLDALSGKEEDRIFTEMISFDSFDANVYLCGHTHDRTVNNWINNRHSINTFVTGIGWPESSSGSHVGNHTYSMYVFNLNINSIDVYVRSTNDDGTFSPDFRIYTSKQDSTRTKLVFPIKAQDAQTYIPLSVGNNRAAKAYYISSSFMESIKGYVKKIERLREIIGAMIEADKNDLFENINIGDESDEKEQLNETDELLYNYLFANLPQDADLIMTDIENIFQNNKVLLFEMFLGFLQRLCQKMCEILVNDACDDNDIVRFHFRFLSDKNTFQYLRLCTSFSGYNHSLENDVSEIEYGQLIEKSYERGCSLIYSVNEEFSHQKLKDKWKNFITVVPLFEKNNYTRKYSNVNKKVPYITFGVTTNDDKFDDLLYCMDYFSIKQTLEEVIEQYLELFCIDINQFCIWAKKALEQEES